MIYSRFLQVQGATHADRQTKPPLSINWAAYGRSGSSHKIPSRGHEGSTNAEQRNGCGAAPMVPPTPNLSHGTRAEASPPDARVSISLPNGHSTIGEGEGTRDGNNGARESAHVQSQKGKGGDRASPKRDREEGLLPQKQKPRDRNVADASGEALDGSPAVVALEARGIELSPGSALRAPPDRAKKAPSARPGTAAKGRAAASPAGADADARAASPAPDLAQTGNAPRPGSKPKPAAGADAAGERARSADAASVRPGADGARRQKPGDRDVPDGVESLESASSGEAGGHSALVVVEGDGPMSVEWDDVAAERDARGDVVMGNADDDDAGVEREGGGGAVPMEVEDAQGTGDAAGGSEMPPAGAPATDGAPAACSVPGVGARAAAVEGATGLPCASQDKVPAPLSRPACHSCGSDLGRTSGSLPALLAVKVPANSVSCSHVKAMLIVDTPHGRVRRDRLCCGDHFHLARSSALLLKVVHVKGERSVFMHVQQVSIIEKLAQFCVFTGPFHKIVVFSRRSSQGLWTSGCRRVVQLGMMTTTY